MADRDDRLPADGTAVIRGQETSEDDRNDEGRVAAGAGVNGSPVIRRPRGALPSAPPVSADGPYTDGGLTDHIGVVVLDPAEQLGIFLASNSVPGIEFVLDPLMTYLFGPPAKTAPIAPRPDAAAHAAVVAGTYRDYEHTRDDMSRMRALMPMIQSRVTAEPDGAIRWKDVRWIEVDPFVYRAENQPDYILFRQGRLHSWGATYERIGWLEQTRFHLAVVVALTVVFLLRLLSPVRRLWRRRPGAREGRAARRLAVLVAVLNLLFLAGLGVAFQNLGESVPLPASSVALLSLPLESLVVTALLLVFSVRAWMKGWLTRGECVGCSTTAVAAIAFLVFLNYWNLLGFRY